MLDDRGHRRCVLGELGGPRYHGGAQTRCDLGDLVVLGGDDQLAELRRLASGFDGVRDERTTAKLTGILPWHGLRSSSRRYDAEHLPFALARSSSHEDRVLPVSVDARSASVTRSARKASVFSIDSSVLPPMCGTSRRLLCSRAYAMRG